MRILAALAAAPLVLGSVAGPAVAEVNEVTPSTNDLNEEKGWAHFTATPDFDAVELTFTTVRNFDSCFEVRVDGEDPTEEGANPNGDVTDGLWDYVCVNASGTLEGVATETRTYEADELVEVRLVFGAETDERFDWTPVEVVEEETPEVITPTRPDTVQECKKGGWKALDYRNQGKCVSDVRKYNNQQRKAAKAEQRAEAKATKAAQRGMKVTAKGAKKAGKGTK